MAAAVDIIESEGMVVIDAAVMENARAIEDVVRQAGGVVLDPWSEDAERSGIVSFQLADEPATVTMQRLDEAEVTVSLRGDWLRAAPHASTDPAVFDVLAEVLDGES
jgi:selenocysteine lyase/cysteine desulfurase